jgi:hypothetical protein
VLVESDSEPVEYSLQKIIAYLEERELIGKGD